MRPASVQSFFLDRSLCFPKYERPYGGSCLLSGNAQSQNGRWFIQVIFCVGLPFSCVLIIILSNVWLFTLEYRVNSIVFIPPLIRVVSDLYWDISAPMSNKNVIRVHCNQLELCCQFSRTRLLVLRQNNFEKGERD